MSTTPTPFVTSAGYVARHGSPCMVCTEQAPYMGDLTGALEDAQSWLNDVDSAVESARDAIKAALTEAGLY